MIRTLLCSLLITTSLFSSEVDEALKIAKAFDLAYTTVVERAQPAVVFIKTEYVEEEQEFEPFGNDIFSHFFGQRPTPRRHNFFSRSPVQQGQGSGFIVSSDGFILTNYHVVENATKITVDLSDDDKKSFEADLIGGDPQTDVAVLKIKTDEELPYLEMQNSENVKVGQRAIAVGNPFDLESSVTIGVVSAKGRHDLEIHDLEDFLQTDASIYPGNSGGPLLDLDGKVIGMNTAMLTNRGNYLGIGFAIPSSILSVVKEQILQNGAITRGYIGVMLQDIDTKMAEALELDKPMGAIITQVMEESPADDATLQQGDIVIEVNGKTMKDRDMVRNSIALLPQGEIAKLKVNRRGDLHDLAVTIGQHNPPTVAMGDVAKKLGITVETLNPELASEYGYKDDETGVIVTDVRKGSMSAMAQMKKGMIINNINHNPVSDADQFNEALQKTEGKNVFMLINEHGQHVFVTLSTNS